MHLTHLLTLACVATTSIVTAATPTGIFVSAGPTTATRDSVITSYGGLNFVDGVLVRIGWGDIEKAPGVYDWTALDRQFQIANGLGLKVALGVVNGGAAPDWLRDAGTQFFDFELPPQRGGGTESIPIPWDETYLSYWESFVAQVGARYSDNEDLALVHITHSSTNGFEMQLPSTPQATADWAAAGYTVDLHVGGIERAIDAFDAAFPDTPLDLEVHPVLGDDTVAKQTVAYGNAQVGDRFGVLSAWWSAPNADNVYQGSYEILKDQAEQTFSAVQIVASATDRPEAFGVNGLSGTLDRAYGDGVRYFEVWHNDVLNPAFEPMLSGLHVRLVPEPTAASLAIAVCLASTAASRSVRH